MNLRREHNKERKKRMKALKKEAKLAEKECKRKIKLRAAEMGIDPYKNFGVDL